MLKNSQVFRLWLEKLEMSEALERRVSMFSGLFFAVKFKEEAHKHLKKDTPITLDCKVAPQKVGIL